MSSMMGRSGFDDRSQSSPAKTSIRKGFAGSDAETMSQMTGVTGMSPSKGGLQEFLVPIDISAINLNKANAGKKGGDGINEKDMNRMRMKGSGAPSEKSQPGKSMMSKSKRSGGPGTASRKSRGVNDYDNMDKDELD